MKKYPSIITLFLSILLFSCGGKQGKTVGEVTSLDSIRYATGFTVSAFDNYTVAEIINPWDTATILQRYILVDRNQPVPAGLPEGRIVRVPVQNLAVYSAVHIAFIDLLGEIDRVIGVCEPQYMNTPAIHEGITNGRIADLGESVSPNVERIVDINTEVIITSPFQNMSYGAVEKLGIPIIEGADYMENSPLGRAEWIRFYGLLFDKVELADSLFKETESRYVALKEKVADIKTKPTVLPEKRYGATWFVPAGESYMAQLYADAGGDYIFKDTEGAGSVPMSFEAILDQAIHADFWLIKYHDAKDLTYAGLRGEYTPYENFDAFKKRSVYASNSAKVPYYEETPLHPDYLLADLARIFHPELFPEYTLRYFHALED
ncbi:ABC transporter substrate-binding protein [Massilibacteroides sp.]|uniref:ABC transporter substrate-binding protein n=1 Tax=Massilibacteroides sp. TaxID=2034766 RepID=UPI0026019FBF|nr:ABC transporter substrate-binding protein [Massilibacteroides sp.]MDD4514001.1 ABC transporter substrate-binding protein [Massilibacteroides sp.]